MFRLFSASVIIFSIVFSANAWGQNDAGSIRHIRVLETDDFFDLPTLDGLVFPPKANSVLVLDQPIPDAGTLVLVPPGGLPGDQGTLSLEISDPINITFDSRANRLFLFEGESSELTVVDLRRFLKKPNAIQRFHAAEFGVKDPGGIAVDPKTGTLFILDQVGPKLVQVDPGPQKNYAGAAALEEGRISERLIPQSPGPLRGLGFNHADGRLYVFSPSGQELYTITENSQFVRVGSFSGFDRIEPRGFVFVPSLDQTDDPGIWNLYIVSGGGPGGKVSEWKLKLSAEPKRGKK